MKTGLYKIIMSILLLFIGGCFFSSCKKEGPAGPAGNANVKGDTILLTNTSWQFPGSWALQSGGGSTTIYNTRYVDIATDLITADILKKGSVSVYFKPNNDGWVPLPYTFQVLFPSSYYHNYMFEYRLGKIRLHFFWSAAPGGTVPAGLSTFVIPSFSFKYVVIAAN